jgi:hypothetical protein
MPRCPPRMLQQKRRSGYDVLFDVHLDDIALSLNQYWEDKVGDKMDYHYRISQCAAQPSTGLRPTHGSLFMNLFTAESSLFHGMIEERKIE